MSIDPPAPPTPSEWDRFGVVDVIELHAGHQSRVFAAQVAGVDLAIKLTDGRLADAALLEARLSVMESMAVDLAEVVAPGRLGGRLVQRIGNWLMTSTPIVHGEPPDLSRPETGELMGQTLARLHGAMADADHRDLPPVAALGTMTGDVDRSTWQLLHGDFSDRNTISTPTGIRIFDLDDCGCGPPQFDVANSIYMVLFDAEVHDHAERYTAFRPSFLRGYETVSGTQLGDAVIDEWIHLRIRALGSWLDDVSSAPIGIQTSSPQWRKTLRSFVRSHT